MIHHAHKNNVQKITENTKLLKTLIEISLEYPNIQKNYKIEDMKILIEKSADKFIKRISINSDTVNVSINLMECNFDNIERKYFKVFNFEEINS